MATKIIPVQQFLAENAEATKARRPADVPGIKAYDNGPFMHSLAARPLRVQAEMLCAAQMLEEHKVDGTVLFFGSARNKPMEDIIKGYTAAMEVAEQLGSDATLDQRRQIAEWKAVHRQAQRYEDARWIAHEFTKWCMAQGLFIMVASGGGPGIMEGTNRGAAEADKGRSIGFGITLPFEPELNPWVTESMGINFHYFFTRKYIMAYYLRALVAFPGGFGTLDELFELLTLKQTGKIGKPMPVILYDGAFWKELINFNVLVREGVISARDMDLIQFTSSKEECLEMLITGIRESMSWHAEREQRAAK